MKIEFTKMHGAGNDYVYVDCTKEMLPNPGAISEYVSHRRFGKMCIRDRYETEAVATT